MWFCLSKQAPYWYIAKVLRKAKFENNPKRIWFVGTPKVNDLKKGDDMISPVVEQSVSKLRPSATTRSWSAWRTPRRGTGPSPSRRSAPSILSSSSVCAPRRTSGETKRINRKSYAESWSRFFLKEMDGEGQPASSEWFYQHDEEPLPVRSGIEARGNWLNHQVVPLCGNILKKMPSYTEISVLFLTMREHSQRFRPPVMTQVVLICFINPLRVGNLSGKFWEANVRPRNIVVLFGTISEGFFLHVSIVNHNHSVVCHSTQKKWSVISFQGARGRPGTPSRRTRGRRSRSPSRRTPTAPQRSFQCQKWGRVLTLFCLTHNNGASMLCVFNCAW